MLRNIALVLHLLGFALVWAGVLASIFIGRYYRLPDKAGLIREFEQLELRIVRRTSIDGMLLVLLAGGLLVYGNPDWMKRGWLHAKTTLALLAFAALRDQARALTRLQDMRWSDDTGVSVEAFRTHARRASMARGAAIALLLAIAWLAVAKPF